MDGKAFLKSKRLLGIITVRLFLNLIPILPPKKLSIRIIYSVLELGKRFEV